MIDKNFHGCIKIADRSQVQRAVANYQDAYLFACDEFNSQWKALQAAFKPTLWQRLTGKTTLMKVYMDDLYTSDPISFCLHEGILTRGLHELVCYLQMAKSEYYYTWKQAFFDLDSMDLEGFLYITPDQADFVRTFDEFDYANFFKEVSC